MPNTQTAMQDMQNMQDIQKEYADIMSRHSANLSGAAQSASPNPHAFDLLHEEMQGLPDDALSVGNQDRRGWVEDIAPGCTADIEDKLIHLGVGYEALMGKVDDLKKECLEEIEKSKNPAELLGFGDEAIDVQGMDSQLDKLNKLVQFDNKFFESLNKINQIFADDKAARDRCFEEIAAAYNKKCYEVKHAQENAQENAQKENEERESKISENLKNGEVEGGAPQPDRYTKYIVGALITALGAMIVDRNLPLLKHAFTSEPVKAILKMFSHPSIANVKVATGSMAVHTTHALASLSSTAFLSAAIVGGVAALALVGSVLVFTWNVVGRARLANEIDKLKKTQEQLEKIQKKTPYDHAEIDRVKEDIAKLESRRDSQGKLVAVSVRVFAISLIVLTVASLAAGLPGFAFALPIALSVFSASYLYMRMQKYYNKSFRNKRGLPILATTIIAAAVTIAVLSTLQFTVPFIAAVGAAIVATGFAAGVSMKLLGFLKSSFRAFTSVFTDGTEKKLKDLLSGKLDASMKDFIEENSSRFSDKNEVRESRAMAVAMRDVVLNEKDESQVYDAFDKLDSPLKNELLGYRYSCAKKQGGVLQSHDVRLAEHILTGENTENPFEMTGDSKRECYNFFKSYAFTKMLQEKIGSVSSDDINGYRALRDLCDSFSDGGDEVSPEKYAAVARSTEAKQCADKLFKGLDTSQKTYAEMQKAVDGYKDCFEDGGELKIVECKSKLDNKFASATGSGGEELDSAALSHLSAACLVYGKDDQGAKECSQLLNILSKESMSIADRLTVKSLVGRDVKGSAPGQLLQALSELTDSSKQIDSKTKKNIQLLAFDCQLRNTFPSINPQTLTIDQLGALSDEQVAGFTTDQLNDLAKGGNGKAKVQALKVGKIQADKIAEIEPQIFELMTKKQVESLNEAQVQKMTAEQLNALATGDNGNKKVKALGGWADSDNIASALNLIRKDELKNLNLKFLSSLYPDQDGSFNIDKLGYDKKNSLSSCVEEHAKKVVESIESIESIERFDDTPLQVSDKLSQLNDQAETLSALYDLQVECNDTEQSLKDRLKDSFETCEGDIKSIDDANLTTAYEDCVTALGSEGSSLSEFIAAREKFIRCLDNAVDMRLNRLGVTDENISTKLTGGCIQALTYYRNALRNTTSSLPAIIAARETCFQELQKSECLIYSLHEDDEDNEGEQVEDLELDSEEEAYAGAGSGSDDDAEELTLHRRVPGAGAGAGTPGYESEEEKEEERNGAAGHTSSLFSVVVKDDEKRRDIEGTSDSGEEESLALPSFGQENSGIEMQEIVGKVKNPLHISNT